QIDAGPGPGRAGPAHRRRGPLRRRRAAVLGGRAPLPPPPRPACAPRPGRRPPGQSTPRSPHDLSGGQQQRVVIAGALALDPAVIVADEPVSSLDASVRGEILKLILRLRDELTLSALIVSHDLGVAWNIADRVAVMYLGRIF